jgi:uncharacterized protein (UPF0261 family)
MTIPTQVAPDDARHDYIARVYKMTHAELFAELMRVHTEANRLVGEAVAAEREACAGLVDHILREGGGTYGDAIRARGMQEGQA